MKLDKIIGAIMVALGIISFSVFLLTAPLTGGFKIVEILYITFMLVFYCGMVMLGIWLMSDTEQTSTVE